MSVLGVLLRGPALINAGRQTADITVKALIVDDGLKQLSERRTLEEVQNFYISQKLKVGMMPALQGAFEIALAALMKPVDVLVSATTATFITIVGSVPGCAFLAAMPMSS